MKLTNNTLTREDIAREIQDNVPLNILGSRELVDNLVDLIKRSIGKDGWLLVTGFGRFEVKAKKERLGRNPQTGERLMLESRKVVGFYTSRLFKDLLNNEDAAKKAGREKQIWER